MCKVIAVANQKGGVGKTTTTYSLGSAMAKKGKKVLGIDFDPQGSLTMFMGYDNDENITTYISSLMGDTIGDKELPKKEKYIISTGSMDLIPGNIELSAIETSLVNAMSRETILKSIISELRLFYDYILIDCLDMPMKEALSEIAVTDNIKNALIQDNGELSPIWKLIRCYEVGDWENARLISNIIDFDEKRLSEGYLKALTYANNILKRL